jgi:hypothetical protein
MSSDSMESLASSPRMPGISIIPDQVEFLASPPRPNGPPPPRPSREGTYTHYNDIGVPSTSYDSGVALVPSIPVLYTYEGSPPLPPRNPRRRASAPQL